MTVRIGYMTREARGGAIKGLRLVGQGSDESWSMGAATSAAAGGASEAGLDAAAAWIADRLGQTRSAGRLEMLCLDADGGVCSWVSSPRVELAAAVARMGSTSSMSAGVGGVGGAGGGGGDSGEGSTTPLTYFAGDEGDSSIQALVAVGDEEDEEEDRRGGAIVKAKRGGRKSESVRAPERIAVLATGDVSARVLMDALDRYGVEVHAAASIWHAMARAWDPDSPLAPGKAGTSREGVAESAPTVGTILVDPAEGRLMWAWSRAGDLLAGGSMRLRTAVGGEGGGPRFGEDEAARLASEWMSWSVQIGRCPRRVVCVVPGEGTDAQAATFGQALGQAWPEATVDMVVHADPIGVTLTRLAAALEGTPAPKNTAPPPAASLVALSDRPGRAHRKFYWWIALFVLAASVLTGVVAWQFRQRAVEIRAQADAWKARWNDDLKVAYPAALGKMEPPKVLLEDEIARLQKDLVPAQSKEAALPVLEEFETISMVLQDPEYALDKVEFFSQSEQVTIRVQAKSLKAAEALATALRAISGSHVESWDWERSGSGPAPAAGGAESTAPVWYVYRGKFAKAPAKAGGGS